MYTNDIDYTSGRLRHTLIRLEGRLVYCDGVSKKDDGELVVYYHSDLETTHRRVQHSLFLPIKMFDLSSPPLGYTIYNGSSFYVCRAAMRNDWKQGIRAENLRLFSKGRVSRYNLRDLRPLTIPVSGVYPSYREVVEKVEDVYESCVFSRHFSLDDRGRLWYRERETVGKDKDGEPELGKDYLWLQELLTEEQQNDNTRYLP